MCRTATACMHLYIYTIINCVTEFWKTYHLHTSEIITTSNFAALIGITESPNIDGGKIDG